MLELFTVIHPIGPDDVPNHPQGWRWAIHTDDQFHQVEQGCINAGFEASQSEAESMLSRVLITGRRMLTAAGATSTVVAHVLADCPLTKDIVDMMAMVH